MIYNMWYWTDSLFHDVSVGVGDEAENETARRLEKSHDLNRTRTHGC